VTALAFDRTGCLLAVVKLSGQVEVWDVSQQPAELRLQLPFGKTTALAFSPTGPTLAVGGANGAIQLWHHLDKKDPKAMVATVLRPPTGRRLFALAYSPAGTRLAAASDNGNIHVWDLTLAPVLAALPATFPASSLGKGPLLLACAILSGNTLTTLQTGHKTRVTAMAFSPDGATLATGSLDQTKPWDVNTAQVRIWDVNTAKVRITLPGRKRIVLGLAYSPNGEILASAGEDGFVLIWDANTGERRRILAGHGAEVSAVAFVSPSGLVTASRDNTVKLWHLEREKPWETLPGGHAGEVICLALAADGKTFATASRDGRVILWDMDEKRQPSKIEMGANSLASRLAWTQRQVRAKGGNLSSWALSADGTHFAMGKKNGWVTVRNLVSRKDIQFCGTDRGPVVALAFTRDGKSVASVGWRLEGPTNEVKVWELDWKLARCKKTAYFQASGGFRPPSLAFSWNGQLLALGSRVVTVWDVVENKQVATLKGHPDLVWSLAFSPREDRLVTAGSREVKLWDVLTGEELLTLMVGPVPISCLAFSSNGEKLLGGSADGKVVVGAPAPRP
jgi:WD40 repeat protein